MSDTPNSNESSTSPSNKKSDTPNFDESSTAPSNKKSGIPSDIVPYCLVGTAGGIGLSYMTDKYILFPICLLLAAGLGWIKDNNTKRCNNKSVTLANVALKGLTIWVIGPSLLLAAGVGIFFIANKK